VIEALWPHLDAKAGGANLRKAAHHARQALGSQDAIVLRSGQVSLFPSCSVVTDVERFESDTDASVYTGELLPEARYEEWTQARRAALRSRCAELLRDSGDLERLVEVEPTDEPAYRELMKRELAAGSRPAAIRWYGRLRSALRRELGISPAAETQAVYDDCVAGLATSEPVFVGRQLELARATALLRAEPGGALIVRGPAGIGKSAFCRELARLAEREGWKVVVSAATEQAVPYAVLAGAIEQIEEGYSGALEALGSNTREVVTKLTVPPQSRTPVEQPLTRHKVIGALRRLLLAAGNGAPVALVVDDAHLADEATIDVLNHIGSSSGTPILPVLAYRPAPAPDTLTRGVNRLVRGGKAIEIDLEPLEHEDAAALVAAGTPIPRAEEVVDRIVELAEGNPFLTLELARSAVAGVPALVATARDAIVSRFLDLDQDVVAALGRLAVGGDEFDTSAAVALLGTSEEQGFAQLDLALAAGVLVVSGGRYRFRHELVRQALIEQLPPHELLVLHRESARRLTAGGAAPGLIARHWLEGDRADDAQEWLLAAARQATQLGAYGDALGHLAPLLDHEPNHAEGLRLRAEALDIRGDRGAPAAYAAAALVAGPEAHNLKAKQALATVKLGDPSGALRVLEGVEPTSAEGKLAQALAFAGCAALGHGDPEVGTAKAAEARRMAIREGDRDAVAIASWAHAAAAHARGDLRGSVRADLRETYALPKLAVSVFDGQLCITQRLLYGARPYSDVIEFANAFVEEAKRLGAARGHAFGVTIRGEAKLLNGRLDEADADLSAGVDLHREIGAATGEAFALQRRSEVALHRGDRARGVALLDEALEVARESDVGFHLLDRIYGARIVAASDAVSALAALEEAEDAVRGPAETCPGCRITLAVPAAIAAARAGDMERLDHWEEAAEYLAAVVMRLPAWDAALAEIRGYRAQLIGDPAASREEFRVAAEGFAASGQPLDEARCAALAGAGTDPSRTK
jgi:tetratricopeptide (TPR) repeat protein